VDSSSQRYEVGQSVRHSAGQRRFGSNSNFKIGRLTPTEGDSLQYRIKSASEGARADRQGERNPAGFLTRPVTIPESRHDRPNH
jgi:hypothetical protein